MKWRFQKAYSMVLSKKFILIQILRKYFNFFNVNWKRKKTSVNFLLCPSVTNFEYELNSIIKAGKGSMWEVRKIVAEQRSKQRLQKEGNCLSHAVG